MPSFARVLAPAIALSVIACAGETPEQAMARMEGEAAAARAEIVAINAKMTPWMVANTLDSVMAYYASDAVVMPPEMPQVQGTAAIRKFFEDNPFPPGSSMEFQVASVVANGPVAVERGTYTFTMPAMDTSPAMAMTGKYLSHWKLVDGAWKLAATTWSDDAPMMPPSGG